MIRLASSSISLRYVWSQPSPSKSNPLDADEGEESELVLLLLDAGWKTGTAGFIGLASLGAKIEIEKVKY